jgi:hypothetical protein
MADDTPAGNSLTWQQMYRKKTSLLNLPINMIV